MNFTRLIGRLVLLIAVALSVALPSSFAQAPPRTGGEIILISSEEPDTLDPQKTSAAVTGNMMRFVGDTLVTKDMRGAISAGLARSWSVSPDGLVWTFVLRDNVRFHDGTPLNAAAVEASIKRALAPETKSPIAGALFGPVANVQASGQQTVAIRLKEPFSPFLDNLTDPRAMIISPQAAQQLGDRFGRSPVGTGAFRFQEWRSADRIILVRNPDYQWGPSYAHAGPAYIERLILRIAPEAAAQVAAFERGELSITFPGVVPATDVRRLQATNRYQFHTFLRKGLAEFMEFNVTKEPFTDVRVRRAFGFGIEKKSILHIALEDLGEVAHGPLPPSIWGYWDGIKDHAPGYDPGQAKRLLAEAGWQAGPGGTLQKEGRPFTFTAFIPPTDLARKTAQIVQSQLRAYGVQMEIQAFEFGTLLAKGRAGEHNAIFLGYTYTSPDIFYLWFHSSNVGTGLAFSHNKDKTLDKMIEDSRTLTDSRRRLEIYRELQKYVVDKALWVPLFINTNYIAVQPNVQGVKIHPDGFIVMNDVFLR